MWQSTFLTHVDAGLRPAWYAQMTRKLDWDSGFEVRGAGGAVGSHFTWRITSPLPALLQNSHRNGGRVFLIFVANPRTVRSCRSAARAASAAARNLRGPEFRA